MHDNCHAMQLLPYSKLYSMVGLLTTLNVKAINLKVYMHHLGLAQLVESQLR